MMSKQITNDLMNFNHLNEIDLKWDNFYQFLSFVNSTSISGIEVSGRQIAGHYGQAALAIKTLFFVFYYNL